jgi:hypothetical protein
VPVEAAVLVQLVKTQQPVLAVPEVMVSRMITELVLMFITEVVAVAQQGQAVAIQVVLVAVVTEQ